MHDRVRRMGHPDGAHRTRRRTEQGEQFRRATAHIFVRLATRRPVREPSCTGMRDCLIWPGFVLAPDGDAARFGQPIGGLDHPFFSSVSGSTTVTTPLFRTRWAVPVGH